MKKFFYCALLLASTPALACTEFAGTYVCTDPRDSSKPAQPLVVSQTAADIRWTNWKTNQGPYRLDQDTKVNLMGLPVTYTASCEGETLRIVGVLVAPWVGERQVADIEMTKTAEGLVGRGVGEAGAQELRCVRQ